MSDEYFFAYGQKCDVVFNNADLDKCPFDIIRPTEGERMSKTPGSKMKQPSKGELRQIIADQAGEISRLTAALEIARNPQSVDNTTEVSDGAKR